MTSASPAIEHLHPLGRLAIAKLYNAPAEDVPRFDIAEMNLISAAGLPGTEGMNIGAMLGLLGDWTKRIADHTLKSIPVFHKYRSDYGTLARFRMTAMLQALTREYGVRYNPERIVDPYVWTDSEDSSPRRAGAATKGHMFVVARAADRSGPPDGVSAQIGAGTRPCVLPLGYLWRAVQHRVP